jgi:hypothetical protein
VAREVALTVAVDVEPADLARSVDRLFPDGAEHALAAPFQFFREANVHREQARHDAIIGDLQRRA